MSQGMIPRELIDEILDRTDIVPLIESYLPLKRQGRNLVGLCPFHLEDTPSFSVSPDKQMFYCFGCQKGGNAISFIMEYEHLSFQEAVAKLAQKVGVTLPQREMTANQKRVYDEKRRLIQINKAAAAYYREQLKRTPFALTYLDKRGVSEEVAERFLLGFAADSWENLKQFLLKKGFTESDMLKAGVVSQGESGKYFDRFRNRLMFPICDKKGDVIAFGGRVLDDSLPKYLNTPETAIFHKGQNLYGLHLAFPNMRKEEEAILMEGNVDVITAHQYGVDNAVAPLGTAFTEEHAKILKRYCNRVTVAFDGDGAGQRATNKTLDLLIQHGFRVYAMEIPSPHDPDDYLRAYGKMGWDRLKANSLSYMDFKIKVAMAKFDPATAEGKADILKELGPSLFAVKNLVEQSEYIREISEKLDISEDLLRMDIQRKASQGRSDIGSGVDFSEEKLTRGITTAKNSVLYFAAENESVFAEIDEATGWNFLDNAAQKTIVKTIKEHLSEYTWRFRDLMDLAAEEEKSMIVSYIMDDPFTLVKDKNTMFRDCWRSIRKEALMKEKDEIQREIKECEKSGNNGEVDILLRNFTKIQQELRKL
jgi:DNA primase